MFDLGFIKDISTVLRRLPEHDQRLNMLFSATLSQPRARARVRAHERSGAHTWPDKMTVDRVAEHLLPSNQEKPALLTLRVATRTAR
jgi:ATP-dependent RNA helicase RhlB